MYRYLHGSIDYRYIYEQYEIVCVVSNKKPRSEKKILFDK